MGWERACETVSIGHLATLLLGEIGARAVDLYLVTPSYFLAFFGLPRWAVSGQIPERDFFVGWACEIGACALGKKDGSELLYLVIVQVVICVFVLHLLVGQCYSPGEKTPNILVLQKIQ